MEWRWAPGEWTAITPLRLLLLRQLIVVPAEELPFGIGLIDKNKFNNQPGQLTIAVDSLFDILIDCKLPNRCKIKQNQLGVLLLLLDLCGLKTFFLHL